MRRILFFVCLLAGCARPVAPPPVAVAAPRPSLLREGDIVFQTLNCGSLCEAIIATTPCAAEHPYNHCGVVRFVEGKPYVVEAIGNTVQQTPLTAFLRRDTASGITVGRVASRLAAEAGTKAARYIGRPYDDAFLPGDSALYCSELVWEAYRGTESGERQFLLHPMTFRTGGKTHEGWTAYYTALGVLPPEGEPGINPCGIAGDTAVQLLRFTEAELLTPLP